jgi:hypothetical protein
MTRRHVTKSIAALRVLPSLLLANGAFPLQQGDEVGSVLAAFEEVPIVAITEPHWNVEVHEFLRTLLRDPRCLQRVDDIVVEFACASHQSLLDRYVAGEDVPVEELRPVWRDTAVSPQMTWDAPVYLQFFQTVRDVNLAAASNGSQRRMRVLAGDPPIDWDGIDELDQLLSFYDDPELERDAHFARIVEQEVLDKGRRALLISGGGHLTRRNLWVSPAPNPSPNTTTVHLLVKHPDAVHVVYTLSSRILDSEDLVARLRKLPSPSIIPLESHWLGAWAASDFSGVRRYNVEGPGKWPFEGLPFSDVADSALYLGMEFTDSLPPFDYQSEAYRKELNRRRRILGAPERTRVDEGISQAEALIDARRFDEATAAIESIKTWDPDSPTLDERLMELFERIEERTLPTAGG